MAAGRQGARQFAVATPKVEDGFAAAQGFEELLNAGLESEARRREVASAPRIEATIEIQQAVNRGRVHAVIIMGIIFHPC